MNKTFGLFIFLGLLFGGIFGIFFGSRLENPLLGVGFGALGGVFLGWFIAAAVRENDIKKKNS